MQRLAVLSSRGWILDQEETGAKQHVSRVSVSIAHMRLIDAYNQPGAPNPVLMF